MKLAFRLRSLEKKAACEKMHSVEAICSKNTGKYNPIYRFEFVPGQHLLPVLYAQALITHEDRAEVHRAARVVGSERSQKVVMLFEF